jgi:hypothetical protein
MDFAPLAKGRLPEGLIDGLRQVKAGMDDAGPPFSASGLPWCPGGSGRGSAALGHESLSYGLPRAFYGPWGREGTGITPRRFSVTALPLTYFPRRHN